MVLTIKFILVALLLHHAVNTNTIRVFYATHKHYSSNRIRKAVTCSSKRLPFRANNFLYVFLDQACRLCLSRLGWQQWYQLLPQFNNNLTHPSAIRRLTGKLLIACIHDAYNCRDRVPSRIVIKLRFNDMVDGGRAVKQEENGLEETRWQVLRCDFNANAVISIHNNPSKYQ